MNHEELKTALETTAQQGLLRLDAISQSFAGAFGQKLEVKFKVLLRYEFEGHWFICEVDHFDMTMLYGLTKIKNEFKLFKIILF